MPFLLLLLCCGLLTACEPEANTETQASSEPQVVNHGRRNVPPERMLRVQTTEHYRVSYQPMTNPIPFNKPFRVTVDVQDLATTRPPEKSLTLAADADMPEHNHGMQITPKIKAMGPGR